MILAVSGMLLTGLFWAVVGVIFGLAPSAKKELYSFFALNGLLFTTFVYTFNPPLTAPLPEILKLAILIVPSAMMELIGFFLLKRAMECGGQGISWSIVQSSMILPFLGSVFLLKNPAGLYQWGGMVLILASLILFGIAKTKGENGGSGNDNRKYLCFVGIAFLSVGTGQFLRIVPGYGGFSPETLTWRLPLQAPVAMIFWFSFCTFKQMLSFKNIWKYSIPYAIVVTAGQFCFYLATDAADQCRVTAIVVPVSIGTCIVLFTLYCTLFRREKLKALSWIGIAMTVAGIFFIAAR